MALLVLVGFLQMESECAALERQPHQALQGAQGSCAVLLNQHAALKHWAMTAPESQGVTGAVVCSQGTREVSPDKEQSLG